MRRNTRKSDYPVPEILNSDETLEALQEIAQSGNTDLIRASVYKGTRSINNRRTNEVSNILAEIYYNKCAYCENIEHKPEVEHFRPKKDVKDTTHSGYYWLCYEWTNLLPSCRYCNTEGGKGNKFPIMGERVENPEFFNGRLDQTKCIASNSPLIDERSYLLHPEIDEPELYFKFSNNGTIIGIDADGRGNKTIETCNLNRDNLLYLRQKEAIDELKNLIEGVCTLLKNGSIEMTEFRAVLNMLFQKYYEKQQPDKPFSLIVKYIFEHFTEIIIPLLEESIREIITEAYNAYLQENPN